MVTALVALAVFALVVALVVAFAFDPGPSPAESALAYEEAWDRLDFSALWDLSGDELRDGLDRKAFIAAKQAAYSQQQGLGQLAREVTLEDTRSARSIAVVHTRVELRDGGTARNEVRLTKRAGRWVVVAYQLRTDAPPAPAT
jgi:hypothetical protein